MRKINDEKKTLTHMVSIYCKRNHGLKNPVCDACYELTNYAHNKLNLCRYGDEKTACVDCTTHCYATSKREKIREVMRYSGPRMILYYPVDFFKYFYHKLKYQIM